MINSRQRCMVLVASGRAFDSVCAYGESAAVATRGSVGAAGARYGGGALAAPGQNVHARHLHHAQWCDAWPGEHQLEQSA